MRFPVQETKLIKTTRFEPEELDRIEQVARILEEDALDDREDPPSESQVIRMLIRLGPEAFHERRKPAAPRP